MRGFCFLPALLVLGACGSSPTRPALRPVNAGLETLASESVPSGPTPGVIESATAEPQDPWARAALDLEEILRQQRTANATQGDDESDTDPSPTPPAKPGSESPGEAGTPPEKPQVAEGSSVEEHGRAEQVEPEPQDPEEPSQTVLATNEPMTLGQRLRQLLIQRAAQSSEPLSDTVRAAIIEGALGLPSDEELADLHLHPSEVARIDALRTLVGSLTNEDLSSDAVLEELERLSRELSASLHGFRLRDAALCTEVRGLGDYDPIEDPTFLAGKPHWIIVYSEPDRFASREKHEGGTTLYELEVSQELTLYHDAPGDLQVWHQPRGRIREASRRPKRDLYLVHEIVLPARLSVGSYVLKVRTRDEVSGASAERSLPIRIVADPRLARAGE